MEKKRKVVLLFFGAMPFQIFFRMTVVCGRPDKWKKLQKTRLKILPVLTREHYTSLLHWV
jgi:hypothetical protein